MTYQSSESGEASQCHPLFETKLSEIAEMEPKRVQSEVERLGTLSHDDLTSELGPYETYPYDQLRVLLAEGSDDEDVAEVLREKRVQWLRDNPNERIGNTEGAKGVITVHGEFIPWSAFEHMTAGERRGVLVGNTCSHYEHDVPGLDDAVLLPGQSKK